LAQNVLLVAAEEALAQGLRHQRQQQAVAVAVAGR
jgi:hypothetical protein